MKSYRALAITARAVMFVCLGDGVCSSVATFKTLKKETGKKTARLFLPFLAQDTHGTLERKTNHSPLVHFQN